MIKERRPIQLQVILDEEHGRRFSPLSKEIRTRMHPRHPGSAGNT